MHALTVEEYKAHVEPEALKLFSVPGVYSIGCGTDYVSVGCTPEAVSRVPLFVEGWPVRISVGPPPRSL